MRALTAHRSRIDPGSWCSRTSHRRGGGKKLEGTVSDEVHRIGHLVMGTRVREIATTRHSCSGSAVRYSQAVPYWLAHVLCGCCSLFLLIYRREHCRPWPLGSIQDASNRKSCRHAEGCPSEQTLVCLRRRCSPQPMTSNGVTNTFLKSGPTASKESSGIRDQHRCREAWSWWLAAAHD
jgi:hypothetical protein